MPTSFQVLFLGNLAPIDTGEGDQNVSTAAVNSWLGTYGSAADPLASFENVKDWAPVSFAGGQPTNYDIDNNNSNDQFSVDGVTQTHDATMIFNATITRFDGSTANITAVVTQATNGDVYLAPEFSRNADQAAIEAGPIQSITLISPVYAFGNTGQGYNLVADRAAADLVPCFTPGTQIATKRGEVAVERLQIGDQIMTRDNGIQEIRWIGGRSLTPAEMAAKPAWQPVLVRAGSLGPNLPETDLLLSPNHRILMSGDRAMLHFAESEVLAAAKHLTDIDGVDRVQVADLTYIHLMFDRHEVVLSNGAWTESFLPGDYTLRGVGQAQRDEILSLFPELADAQGLQSYGAARKTLKRHEAKILTH